ncbi:MAG: DNA polymerase I [Mycoplasmatales bacterium]
MKKLLLIDGSNLIFRAYYATEKNNIKTLDGRPANAIQTLVGMLNKLFETEKPDYLFVALDTGKPTFRHEQYEDYKGTRSETPVRLKEQFPMAHELYEEMGIAFGAVDGYEADDLIATYAKTAKAQGMTVKVFSGDKDMLQLVDHGIDVLTPAIGFAKEVHYNEAVFQEKFEFPSKRFIEYKALVGDSSDNIIGINKLGDKTAKKLINEYESIEAIIEAAKAGTIKGVVGQNIAENAEQIYHNLELVTLIYDAPTELPLEELKFNFNIVGLVKYCKQLGFSKLVSQYSKLADIDQTQIINHNVEVITIDEFDEKVHTGTQTAVYTQTLKANYFSSESLGIAFSSEAGTFFLPQAKISDNFKAWLADETKIKITYNLKRLLVLFGEVGGVKFDSYLAASLIDVQNYKLEINTLMAKYGADYVLSFADVYKVISNPQVPEPELLARDLGYKAAALFQTYLPLVNLIEQNELHQVLYEIEMPLSYVLADVEKNGIYIDQAELSHVRETYEQKEAEIEAKIKEITDVNFKSTKQLSEYLFEELKVPTAGLKKTKTGISTDVNNLELLITKLDCEDYEDVIELIKLILDHRSYAKLVSTYLKGLEQYIDEDQRIHPIYHQLQSETGRLSTIDPSIQNIPIKTEKGQIIRSFFSGGAKKIIAIDYSQIELRLMAELSGDEHLMQAFVEGEDIHQATAAKMFGNDNLKENRNRAKAINFGIIYGMSSYGLAKQVGIDNKTASEFIEKYFATYPKVHDYLEACVTFAKEHGYVKTITNRRRTIEHINDGSFNEKEHAKRTAVNTPVQGGAADLIKVAMIEVDKYLKSSAVDVKMIMQIHDELVFEVAENDVNEVMGNIKKIMENVLNLQVPLVAEANVGSNWLEAKWVE